MIDAADTGAAAAPIIRLEAVSKSYSAAHGFAVRALDLSIARGTFVSIVGDSGSGKTTLLKMMNRLIEPDTGSLHIAGTRADGVAAHILRRRIGYVFQQVGLFPHLTVAENIAITPRLLGWPESQIFARVSELMALVGLPDSLLARMPAQLSGGQQQRVGVARALAGKPAIMLMDEPFGALDPVTRDALGTEFRRVHERIGLTTVMVTHDVTEAVLLSDRIIAMRRGEIVADGRPHELLVESADPSVRALMDMPRRHAERVTALMSGKAGHG